MVFSFASVTAHPLEEYTSFLRSAIANSLSSAVVAAGRAPLDLAFLLGRSRRRGGRPSACGFQSTPSFLPRVSALILLLARFVAVTAACLDLDGADEDAASGQLLFCVHPHMELR